MANPAWSVAVKNEIATAETKKQCCRRAMVAGLLLGATVQDGIVSLTLPDGACRETAARLIREQFTRDADAVVHGEKVTLSFESRAARILCESRSEVAKLLKCDECAAAFLRGAFLVVGSVNAPDKENFLQFTPPDYDGCVAVKETAASIGVELSASARRGKNYLYMKRRQSIEDLLAILGARGEYFNYLNSGIGKLARGEANRTRNCIARNIMKSVSAAEKQAELLRAAERDGRLGSLPPELAETARLRLAHPSLGIAQLAALHNPPVSKSGVYHRLERITAYLKDKT